MTTNETKRVHNLIIVDESGSMEIIRKQAYTGLNETLQTIRQMQKKFPGQEQRITLLTFNTERTSWLYDNATSAETKDLDWEDYCPDGGTPLYDAIGKGVSKVNAEIKEGDNVLVTIITDGEENSSREWTLELVSNMIAKLKKQGWTFTLIGTDNLDVKKMARNFDIGDHLTFTEDADGTRAMFAKERRCRSNFYECICNDNSVPEGSYFSQD